MIGDDISVTILGVKGNQVRIGVHAPDDVAIHREEVYERVRSECAKQSDTDVGGADSGDSRRYA